MSIFIDLSVVILADDSTTFPTPNVITTSAYKFTTNTYRPYTTPGDSETTPGVNAALITPTANRETAAFTQFSVDAQNTGVQSGNTQFSTNPVYTTQTLFRDTTEELYVDTDLSYQIIFNAVYSQLPVSLLDQQESLARQIKDMINIPKFNETRIKNITAKSTKSEAELLLQFNILSMGNEYPTARDAARGIFNSINLKNNPRIIFSNTAIVQTARASCYWAGSVKCPTFPCSSDTKCFGNYNCDLYCSKHELSLSEQIGSTTTNSNNALLGLIAIPAVLFVIAIVVIVALILYRRPNANKSAIELNEYGYADTTSKYGTGTLRNKSGMTIAEPGIRNKVYSTMGRSFQMGWDLHGNPKGNNNAEKGEKGYYDDDDEEDESASQKF